MPLTKSHLWHACCAPINICDIANVRARLKLNMNELAVTCKMGSADIATTTLSDKLANIIVLNARKHNKSHILLPTTAKFAKKLVEFFTKLKKT